MTTTRAARIAPALWLFGTMATPACDAGDEQQFGDVVLIIAGDAALGAGDMAVQDRLSSQMYETRIVDEPSLTSADVEDEDVGFVYVAASVGSAATLDSLEGTKKAVLVAQAFVADDFGLVLSDAKVREVNVATATPDEPLDTWTIEDVDHPGLGMQTPGPLVVWGADGANVVPMVTPAESATVLASYPGGFATVLAVDRRGLLADGETKSPGRRVLFAHEPRAPSIFTADGWHLFDDVVAWAFPL